MSWSNLKAGISAVVKENNNQEITGANLQNALITMVNSLGANATCGGIAHPNTSPGTPDGPVFWIASEPGVYANFGNTKIDNTGIFTWNGASWSFEELDFMKNMQTDVVVKEDADAAFDIADESGRVALRITSKGHIKTKCFDSENMDIFRTTKLDSPQCVCHGYGSVSKQANTIEYFRAGYAAGYRFFECDAVNCSDGIPVCTHQYNQITVYAKDTHEATTIAMQKVNDVWTIQMDSDKLVEGYTWDSAGNVPIALLSEVIWQVCYFYRCPLHVDGQGLNKALRLAASQYAESLGVGQYVFHELSTGAYTDWQIPCNAIIYASSVADIQTKVAYYKKADNNIIFYLAQGAAAATIKSLADAAHEAGCYLMSWTFGSAASAREWFVNGTDFIITSNSITNNKI